MFPLTQPVTNSSITIALTGASGAQYGLRLLEVILKLQQPVHLILSQAALVVLSMELDLHLSAKPSVQRSRLSERFGTDSSYLSVYADKDWSAPIASGSNISRAMVICPCTTGTLGAIAHGQSDNLIERAADVTLKERKDLILVVRETPYSLIHLENMRLLTQAGALIMPANPGFYHRPQSVEAIIDFMVAKILDQLNLPQTLLPKWGDPSH